MFSPTPVWVFSHDFKNMPQFAKNYFFSKEKEKSGIQLKLPTSKVQSQEKEILRLAIFFNQFC